MHRPSEALSHESRVVRHSLTNKDPAAMTADCSKCGTRVPIQRAGKAGKYFRCTSAKRVLNQKNHPEWVRKNPEKAAANRRPDTHHRLQNRDFLRRRAFCLECDEDVDLTPWGAGMICANRSREMLDPEQADGEFAQFLDNGYSGVGPWRDPYWMPEYESAVPGWKTIG